MRFNKERMLFAVQEGFINATDLADYLVTKGVPFREAHGIVGTAVRYCVEHNKKLEDLEIEDFRKFSDLIDEDVYDILPIEKCVERRNSLGGTSSISTDVQIVEAIRELMTREDTIRKESDLIERCWDELIQ